MGELKGKKGRGETDCLQPIRLHFKQREEGKQSENWSKTFHAKGRKMGEEAPRKKRIREEEGNYKRILQTTNQKRERRKAG